MRSPRNWTWSCLSTPPGVWVPEGPGLSTAGPSPLCRFMEFEAEEEMQNRNTQLMTGSQGLPPAAPLKLDPPGPPAPEGCQQPGKAAQSYQEPHTRGSEGGVQTPVMGSGGPCPCFCHLSSREWRLMFQTGQTQESGFSGSLGPKLGIDLGQQNHVFSHRGCKCPQRLICLRSGGWIKGLVRISGVPRSLIG